MMRLGRVIGCGKSMTTATTARVTQWCNLGTKTVPAMRVVSCPSRGFSSDQIKKLDDTKTSKSGESTSKGESESENASGGSDTKAVDMFMTAMRILVVLGVLSSVSSNYRLMEEARVNDQISTALEQTIETATDSIIKEEWRQAVKEKIDAGDKDALTRELRQLLVVKVMDDEL
jgi:hypothetical protein